MTMRRYLTAGIPLLVLGVIAALAAANGVAQAQTALDAPAGTAALAGAASGSSTLVSAPPPTPTSAGYIALLYYRLSGQVPDYEAWAMASDDYIKANSFDKDLVRREKIAEATRAYQLVTYDDPVVISAQVTLSSYSRAKRGFFVENFRPDTFYSYEFLGRNYAVVPLDLMDFQWLSVGDEKTQRSLEELVDAVKGKVRMFMYLTPTFADKQAPLKLENKDYWLLSGRVQKLQIYDQRGRKLLWEGYGKTHVEQHQQELLDLYK